MVFLGDCVHYVGRNIFGDQYLQGRCVGHRVTENSTDNSPLFQDVLGRSGGIDFFEIVVIVWSQKSKGCRQCAGTDSGHHGKLGPSSVCNPPCKKSGAKGSVWTTAGDCQVGVCFSVDPGIMLPEIDIGIGLKSLYGELRPLVSPKTGLQDPFYSNL